MIIEFDTTTGSILQIVSDPVRQEVIDAYLNAGMNILNLPPYVTNPEASEAEQQYAYHECDIELDYVKDGAVTRRPVIRESGDLSLAVGETVVIDVPEDSTVIMNGETYEVGDTTLELTGEMVASYNLTIECWPYIPCHLKVNVHEA